MQRIHYLGYGFARRSPGHPAHLVLQTNHREIRTAHDQHGISPLHQSLCPVAQLISLTLSGLAQQREQHGFPSLKSLQLRRQLHSLHKKFLVVFLLIVHSAEKTGRLGVQKGHPLIPVQRIRYVKRRRHSLHIGIKLIIKDIRNLSNSTLVGGYVGGFLVDKRLEYVYKAVLIAIY